MVHIRGEARKSFNKMFSSVNSFKAEVDYTQVLTLGEVHEADEEHDGKLYSRVRQKFPRNTDLVNMIFIRPWQKDMSLGQVVNLAMRFELRPAAHHEVSAVLKKAESKQLVGLFDQAQNAKRLFGYTGETTSLAITCLGSAVRGETGELIPLQEVVQFCHWPCRLHLRKLDFDAHVPPAQSIAFVSVS